MSKLKSMKNKNFQTQNKLKEASMSWRKKNQMLKNNLKKSINTKRTKRLIEEAILTMMKADKNPNLMRDKIKMRKLLNQISIINLNKKLVNPLRRMKPIDPTLNMTNLIMTSLIMKTLINIRRKIKTWMEKYQMMFKSLIIRMWMMLNDLKFYFLKINLCQFIELVK